MDDRITDADPGTDPSEEAECWFVRLLEPDCPPEVRAAFERWRNASVANAMAYRRVETLWRQSGDAVLDAAVMAASRRALASEPAPRQLRRMWLTTAGFGLAALLVVIAVPHGLPQADPPGKRYSVQVGKAAQRVFLRDGSSILLDTGSEVVERFSDKTRRIDLLHGQAQFQVQGNKAWPFVVHAGPGTVTAVGTQFQVRLDDDRTGVILLKGRVDVATRSTDAATQSVTLDAGQQVAFDISGHLGNVQSANLERAHGWTQGKLFVHDWRLPALLAEMNRYSSTQLVIADSSLDSLHISGAFRLGDQDSLALALQAGWPVRIDRSTPGRMVLRRR